MYTLRGHRATGFFERGLRIRKYSLKSLLLLLAFFNSFLALLVWGQPWKEELTLRGHEDVVHCVKFSPDGSQIVTATPGGIARIWDSKTGELLFAFGGPENPASYGNIFDKEVLITTGSNNIQLWALKNGNRIFHVKWPNVSSAILVTSPAGLRVIGSRQSGPKRTWEARVWDVKNGKMLCSLGKLDYYIGKAFYSADNTRLFTLTWDAMLWEANTGRLIATLSVEGEYAWPYWFSDDGQKILAASRKSEGQIYMWDCRSGKFLGTQAGQIPRQKWISSRFLSPDGKLNCGVPPDTDFQVRNHRLYVSETNTGKILASWNAHSDMVHTCEFSPVGLRIITGSRDRTAKVWARRARPYEWWGIFWLLEFWATAIFGVALIWSLRRDARKFGKKSSAQ